MKLVDKFIDESGYFENQMSMVIIHATAPDGKFYGVIKPTIEYMIKDDMVNLRSYFAHRAVYEFIKTLTPKYRKLLSTISAIANNAAKSYNESLRLYMFNGSLREKKQTSNSYFDQMKNDWFDLLTKEFMK